MDKVLRGLVEAARMEIPEIDDFEEKRDPWRRYSANEHLRDFGLDPDGVYKGVRAAKELEMRVIDSQLGQPSKKT